MQPNIPSILQKIVQDKKRWIAEKQAAFPLAHFQQEIKNSDRSFYQVLSQGSHQRPAFILECKKASPSKGLIRSDFNIVEIANVYKNYASVISVLTDEKYFQGDFNYLPLVRKKATQPVLCKDFILSKYQVYLARYYQADGILLMLSILDDETYRTLSDLAHNLGMGVLTETSNQKELDRAIKLGAKVIGINNRNLHDLSVDLNRTPPLARQIPADRIVISESGISSHQQVQQLKPYVHGFLIGSSLTSGKDLNNAVRSVLLGEHKVCGLTRGQDVKASYAQGALYGGLIFAESSPRKLSLCQAQKLVKQAPLLFVGVFQNQSIAFIHNIATQLQLFAVQLHGDENAEFITALRQVLPTQCQIWKAVTIDVTEQYEQGKSAVDFEEIPYVDRYVFDSKADNRQGGTGQTFNWNYIPPSIKYKVMLAGGINIQNIEQALQQHCLGIDLNSGVECANGIKDQIKLQTVFDKIQNQ
ncbi:bifunctional indole-3-glycerol phosphate synthase/phosphoribosylanthranilate isomerase [Histophilus somni]|uniref:Multifunctional fusion protein n=1 Tax=Histophilus somni TaxID=731 RepID=A0A9Q7E6R3_HISSO|nr:bifunctional indole-3-glycerol-phosphate synthase TrpC/phosphoribosylanthranilate isomerase TrpF [Histophilus somni]ARU64928.1 bifunctional indole-3-glycerol phosphate synthase/phosphoribosylanthranilate isomerase [Histophilus somni]ARU66793.1 bifunctional indole-3-glycerol phosphate synthase/phosphoribosylanthranilate isomerase [Histophilus somni]ARU68666.1 bifunctional indole-3-glycerol phosphate synthase/phosphoribosylanthranilate isomerase [Histophilus somni]ARU70547.1 bifunctional indol